MIQYNQAPLPFMGQKRRFIKQYTQVIENLPDGITIVDLFGGSGLLSHVAKRIKPQSKVVYNDYDNYRKRLDNISITNALIAEIRVLVAGYPKHKLIAPDLRSRIINCVKSYEDRGYVDYVTLSSSLLFSSKYVTSFDDLISQGFYNNVTLKEYVADGYLDGVEIISCDYQVLTDRYSGQSNVLFLVDPPYFMTETAHYQMEWTISDYLNVLDAIQGVSYIFFTSNKSMMVELCEWVSTHSDYVNPFHGSTTCTMDCTLNYNSKYTDMMICRL